ncbi:hypothetical protein ILYODFUR_032507, partial [Ilyodon furcidens]
NPLLTEKETQDVYQAEEHLNVTLTWIHPVNTTTDSLYMDLMRVEPLIRIYSYHSTYQPEPYTDDQFRGRLRCDLHLVRKGWIQCVLTDLKLSDTGTYQLVINVGGKDDLKTFQLIVRASVPPTSSGSSKSANRGRVGFYVGFGAFVVVIVGFILHNVTHRTL